MHTPSITKAKQEISQASAPTTALGVLKSIEARMRALPYNGTPLSDDYRDLRAIHAAILQHWYGRENLSPDQFVNQWIDLAERGQSAPELTTALKSLPTLVPEIATELDDETLGRLARMKVPAVGAAATPLPV